MKIGIVTFQESENYGAILQAFALQSVLEEKGHKVKIINYHSVYKEKQYSKKWSREKSFLVNLNLLLSLFIKNEKINDVKKNWLKITDKIYTKEDLYNIDQNLFDKYICGSDQIWNIHSTGKDEIYFLDFVKNDEKKIAYAASIGLNSVNDDEKSFYLKMLKNFTNISIREKTGCTIVEKMLNKKVECVLDPTLLLTKNNWMKYASERILEKSYIFLYYIEYNIEMINYVKKIAEKTGLQIVTPLRTIRDIKLGFKTVKMSPADFLSAIEHAEYIVTNSFHGSAFSLNFNKKFAVFKSNRTLSKTNSRIDDFLEMFDLKENVLNLDIDYNSINKSLKEKRKKSIEFLQRSINKYEY